MGTLMDKYSDGTIYISSSMLQYLGIDDYGPCDRLLYAPTLGGLKDQHMSKVVVATSQIIGCHEFKVGTDHDGYFLVCCAQPHHAELLDGKCKQHDITIVWFRHLKLVLKPTFCFDSIHELVDRGQYF